MSTHQDLPPLVRPPDQRDASAENSGGDLTPDATNPGLSIGETSALLDVPAPTLRSWERRYGLPAATRSVGGHRRYTPAEILELRYMRDEVAAGRSAAQAARNSRLRLDDQNPSFTPINSLLAAIRQADDTAILAVLDHARADLGMAAVLDDVVLPAMRHAGALWERGSSPIQDAQFSSTVVRAWLARTTWSPEGLAKPLVLLTVGPSDRHTLGVEGLATLLRTQHVECLVTGPGTTARALVSTAEAIRPGAVVVVSHLSTNRSAAVGAIRAATESGHATFYAGNAFTVLAARAHTPGTFLGGSIAGAAVMIQRHLNR